MQKIQELKTAADLKRDEEYERAIKIIDGIIDRQANDPVMQRVREWNRQRSEQNANQ